MPLSGKLVDELVSKDICDAYPFPQQRINITVIIMKHGKSGTRLYQIWCGMKQRCEYPKHNRFKNYGARGIKVCKRWKDFGNFYQDMIGSYQIHCSLFGEKNTTIDRIDTTKNYTLKNCWWSTLWKQNLNRTNNHLLTYKGQTKPLTQWEREKGFKRGLLESRLRYGWSVEKAMGTPSNRHE